MTEDVDGTAEGWASMRVGSKATDTVCMIPEPLALERWPSRRGLRRGATR
jgi:hypothetical protein